MRGLSPLRHPCAEVFVMGRRSMLKTGCCVAVLILGTAVSAATQVIAIRQGTVTIPLFPPASVNISGTSGFKLQGAAVGWGFTAMTQCEEGCPPGSVVALDAEIAGSNFNGIARLRGTLYEDIGSIGSSENVVLIFSGQVTMPPMSDGPVTVTVPFDLTGSFSYEKDGEGHTAPLTGGGRVTLLLEPAPDGTTWIVTRADFDFGRKSRGTPFIV
jgi:hypothetical protein